MMIVTDRDFSIRTMRAEGGLHRRLELVAGMRSLDKDGEIDFSRLG